ncbi:putative RNA methylase family protein [Patellaria atrata CBS 101060]|uniref:Trimethylguanosine synthase n=1 Tax=Patellaria atrata CBS 101060 TaxID=1346257 RepID=A0A9P4SBH7_9PEZI|nr:putative RNA methylase family protein [Patellaria atrata CBS 101060]
MQPLAEEELTSKRQFHYSHRSQVPPNIQKYWEQRHQIFSKYDEGILLTDNAWFGITPEFVANQVAQDVVSLAPSNKTIIIDAFAGAGGNTIAFALSGRWERVFGIEKDPDVLKCAKRNAEVYGVAKKIFWIEGDCFEVIKARFKAQGKDAVIFASPPWGGPDYKADQVFDLNSMEPYGLDDLYMPFSRITKEIVMYLPRTSNLNQISKYVPTGEQVHVRHYCMKGASKALCVFYGNLRPESSTERCEDGFPLHQPLPTTGSLT